MRAMAKGAKKRSQRRKGKNKPRPAWLPDKSEVVKETTFRSPKGTQYRILTTTEMDIYDRPTRKKQKKTRMK